MSLIGIGGVLLLCRVGFDAKHGDGQYGRVYFAWLDADGKAHNPFVLPQSDPEKDDLTLKSYNIPDLSSTTVPFDEAAVKRLCKSAETEHFDRFFFVRISGLIHDFCS